MGPTPPPPRPAVPDRPVPPPPTGLPHDWVRRTVGAVMVAVAIPAVVVLLFLAALASNPCGAFGDACDRSEATYNQLSVVVLLALGAVVVAVVGIVLLRTGRRRDDTPACLDDPAAPT